MVLKSVYNSSHDTNLLSLCSVSILFYSVELHLFAYTFIHAQLIR